MRSYVYLCVLICIGVSVDSLLLQERHALILERLRADGRVLAPELAAWLKVSEDTIRRDLRDLAAAGLCQKVYGGALRLPLPPAPNDGTLSQRRDHRAAAKSRLAQAAATLIAPGSLVFIDAGSTNLGIAAALPDVPLTVVANAPAPASAPARCATSKCCGRMCFAWAPAASTSPPASPLSNMRRRCSSGVSPRPARQCWWPPPATSWPPPRRIRCWPPRG